MFWLTSLQNTLFPFSLATYEEPRVKNNVISRKLFTNFYYARRNDARRTSRALASLLYFFFPATSVLVALVVMVFFKYPKKLDQDGYKAFFLCTSVFKHLFRLIKEKKHYLIAFCLMTRMQSSFSHARLLLHRAVS